MSSQNVDDVVSDSHVIGILDYTFHDAQALWVATQQEESVALEELLEEEAYLIAVNALDDLLDHVGCLAMDAELEDVTS